MLIRCTMSSMMQANHLPRPYREAADRHARDAIVRNGVRHNQRYFDSSFSKLSLLLFTTNQRVSAKMIINIPITRSTLSRIDHHRAYCVCLSRR